MTDPIALAKEMRARAEEADDAARTAYGIAGLWQVKGSFVIHPDDNTGLPAHAVGGLPAERAYIASACPANILTLLDHFEGEIARLGAKEAAATDAVEGLVSKFTFESARADAAEARVAEFVDLVAACEQLYEAAETWRVHGGDQAHRILNLIHAPFNAVYEAYKPMRAARLLRPASEKGGVDA